MKKIIRCMKCFNSLCLIVGVLSFCVFSAGIADAPIATLKITPSPTVKRGDVLKFSATVSYMAPAMISVRQIDTNWSSEVQIVNYPTKGQPTTVNFTKTFTVPFDAKTNTSFCFNVVRHVEKMPQPPLISDKTCVTVKVLFKVPTSKDLTKSGVKKGIE